MFYYYFYYFEDVNVIIKLILITFLCYQKINDKLLMIIILFISKIL